MDRPLKYRELLKILKRFAVREEKGRGKGSERLLRRMVGAKKYSTTIRCHNEGEQKPQAVVAATRRRLKLTPADGVSDAEFYGK
jgi:hypothetical protein